MAMTQVDVELLNNAAPEMLKALKSCLRLLSCYERVERDRGNVAQADAINRHIAAKAEIVRSAQLYPTWH